MNTIHYIADYPRICLLAGLLLLFAGCGHSGQEPDAYGVFETTDVVVSAEVSGVIFSFDVAEGSTLKANAVIGYIDSTQLFLRKRQLEASIRAMQSQRPDVKTQLAVLEEQLRSARYEQDRIENLVRANAATPKQLDDCKAQIAILERQLAASRSSLQNRIDGLRDEETALRLQIAQIEDQLKKCLISSPIDGTLLVSYAQEGELAVPGKPLFKAGDTERFILRAYLSADQLNQIELGQNLTVIANLGEESISYEGRVCWISSKAEFTPKTIQTNDERANQVYAVKVAVKNDGRLKIGLYGGLILSQHARP